MAQTPKRHAAGRGRDDVPPATQRPFATALGKGSELGRALAEQASLRGSTASSAPRPSRPKTDRGTDDATSFAALVHGVRALGGRAPVVARPIEPAPQASAMRPAPSTMAALLADELRFDVTDDGRAIDGRRIDTDPRELRRLRQRRYPVDGTLDLHGHTVATARPVVEQFVRARRSQGDRAVVVVHGRGSHSASGSSVLRGELAAWLSQGPAAREVAAFTSIGGEPGEHAALFILLAKR
jgi:DNA-nicking Smr family endonuclease